jgi:hypothetical protein
MTVYPMGGFAFEVFQDVFYGVVWIEEEEKMNMIRGPVDYLQIAAKILLEMFSDVGKEGRFIGWEDERGAILGAEERVDPDFGEGGRHCGGR